MCKSAALDCCGCGDCEANAKVLGACEECGKPVYAEYEHYDFGCELVHCECINDYNEKHRKAG